MKLKLEQSMITRFEEILKDDEKGKATIEKYLRDAKNFMDFAGEGVIITKETMIAYKQHLLKKYAVTSANSMLTAVNCFLRVMGCSDCMVKTFKVQREAFRSREKELSKNEYLRLLDVANRKGKKRLFLIMQTICATGIRISELPFITVEALQVRRAKVSLKGKVRTIILPMVLCEELTLYAREKGIRSGSIFVTRSGRPIDRNNILHSMKKLCKEARVPESKVFPHNLRHLFALTYYKAERDVCHLADLLGHSNINTTRIYTVISSEEQEQQIDDLGLVVYNIAEQKNTT